MVHVFVDLHLGDWTATAARQGPGGTLVSWIALAQDTGGVDMGEFANARANGPAQSALCACVPEDPQGPCVRPTAQHAAGMDGVLCQDLAYVIQRGRAQIVLWSCVDLA